MADVALSLGMHIEPEAKNVLKVLLSPGNKQVKNNNCYRNGSRLLASPLMHINSLPTPFLGYKNTFWYYFEGCGLLRPVKSLVKLIYYSA